MKMKPKSCSCYMCRHSPVRRAIHRQADRAYRHAWKVALRVGGWEKLSVVSYSVYTD